MPHEILRFPPVLQLVLLGLLAVYVLVSLLARVSPGLRWLWRDRAGERDAAHLFVYTVVPALMLAVGAAAVFLSWDPAAPLDGGWTLRELMVGPGAALLGLAVIIAGQAMGRGADLDDASRPGAWVPLVAILVGVALLAVGVTTMGRAVKRISPATAPRAQAPAGGAARAPAAAASTLVPNKAPTPAVIAMASAPQKVTRTAPLKGEAPPVTAATAPSRARKPSDVPDTTARTFAGARMAATSGSAAPTAKVPADASAAWTGRARCRSEIPSSSRACAPRASWAMSCSATWRERGASSPRFS